MHLEKTSKYLFIICLISLFGCQYELPRQHDDICKILDANISWYYAAKKARAKWGIPISLQMSIVQRESGFSPHAQPKLEWLFGIIPWQRESSSYGYSQALDGTWAEYIKKNDYSYAFRNDFWDATDFIGWYLDQISQRAHIDKNDAYNLYLAYHVGIVGYNQGRYKNNAQLLKVAEDVTKRAVSYQSQLRQCEPEIDRYWYYPFF